MLKIIDLVTTLISFLPRIVSGLKMVGEVAEKLADFLDQFGKPKT